VKKVRKWAARPAKASKNASTYAKNASANVKKASAEVASLMRTAAWRVL
jgi:hypothetical protein